MIYTHVVAGLFSAAVAGTLIWNTQAWRYEAQMAEREQQIAQATQAAEAAARRREKEMQRYADEIAKFAAQRQQVLADRVATTGLVARGLRDDIARLNASRRPDDPAAAGHADAAARARELVGACADRYRDVAEKADGLRDQVTGLQEWARAIGAEPAR